MNTMSMISRNPLSGLAIRLLGATLICGAAVAQTPSSEGAAEKNPQITIETNHGLILVELDPARAPLSTENFLGYVRDGFYNGTVFHRVIDGFMIQGGGFTEDLQKKPVKDPIKNESDNGVSNLRGTIAMARTGQPHSATAQFYINTVDNPSLDMAQAGSSGWGYAVFGRVVEGMDVVDTIAKVATGRGSNGMRDVPQQPVVIVKATASQ